MRSNDKAQPARMTSPEERAPLYAAYAEARRRGDEIGFCCPDDSIVQYAIHAYDREKYGTEALMLPDWLVDLIEAAIAAEDEMSCDHSEKCQHCYWNALLMSVPGRTMVLAKQAIQLRPTDSRPSPVLSSCND